MVDIGRMSPHSTAPTDAPTIDVALVSRLVRDQFPQWAHLPIHPVDVGGWDNRTFRLGDTLSARLPSGPGYEPQVEKEQQWLPFLAERLPLPVPAPLAQGRPGHGYPLDWSVRRWLDGRTVIEEPIDDPCEFAEALAAFLRVLRSIEATDGPLAGQHSAFRGGPLTTYDDETRRAINSLGDRVPAADALAAWEAGLASPWQGEPVWFHGDVAPGNLLVKDGRLSAVIDFGCSGVGDPACDTVIAWTVFSDASRETFRSALDLDDATWARGRSWALWKALITIDDAGKSAHDVATSWKVIHSVIEEHQALAEHERRAPRGTIVQHETGSHDASLGR
jgi:aminoglycoside phosphotransferase (APT) family kinase protein